MYLPFNDMPNHSRIWIYQSDRELKPDEAEKIKKMAESFVADWTAHNNKLHASFEMLHNIFFIVAVDENRNDASGCSIDKSVNFIKQLEKQFDISFFDRFNIAFKKDDRVHVKPLKDFIENFKEEKLTDSLPVFNNLVNTKGELKSKWEIPLRESWVMGKVL